MVHREDWGDITRISSHRVIGEGVPLCIELLGLEQQFQLEGVAVSTHPQCTVVGMDLQVEVQVDNLICSVQYLSGLGSHPIDVNILVIEGSHWLSFGRFLRWFAQTT